MRFISLQRNSFDALQRDSLLFYRNAMQRAAVVEISLNGFPALIHRQANRQIDKATDMLSNIANT